MHLWKFIIPSFNSSFTVLKFFQLSLHYSFFFVYINKYFKYISTWVFCIIAVEHFTLLLLEIKNCMFLLEQYFYQMIVWVIEWYYIHYNLFYWLAYGLLICYCWTGSCCVLSFDIFCNFVINKNDFIINKNVKLKEQYLQNQNNTPISIKLFLNTFFDA